MKKIFFFFFKKFLRVNSAKNLHDSMLFSILRNKMSFFESTPIGRVLNRFSKDLNSVEIQLSQSFQDFLFCAIDVCSIMIIISASTPLFLIVLIPLITSYIFIQVFIMIFIFLF